MNYLVRCLDEAKSKLTTYVALATAGLAEVLNSWDAAKALFPPWLIAHKQHIIAASALLAIWTRIRRTVASPPS